MSVESQSVRFAEPGDLIRIERGTYVGNLVLDKSPVLEGGSSSRSRPEVKGLHAIRW